ncbi:MAG TPA: hypothetical protein VII49_06560 [Rhizomicrobium sp.]
MSLGKRLWHALTAFLYLQLYELLFGYLVLAVVLYFTKSIAVPPDLQGAPRLVYALEGPVGIIVIYYFLFGYFFASLLAVLILRITPFFNRTTLAAVNALIYAVHGLWVIHSTLHLLPLSMWAAWLIIVAFNALSPYLLPRRLFDS